ncbi:hypothetical protein QA645_19480 [Bradyrhizobium sp. CIAT3101]|uniref:hypothetical protein n=1 Tax=Bradyrhizobium sp. CIAT3101 TaxID=439387 RepID=UPI0024B1143C|nr:hypothetical protein [Bradyrhizobium sp. CIAT3101]WFU84838.1 hypothetical protein QA645_19480 [Bradyrhizobium sp. CIAT3101]
MAKLRNRRHELVAQALAGGKSRADAMTAAGYTWHRGNQNRLAQSPDVVARVEELRRASDHIVDIRKMDRGRIMIELARIACAEPPLRAAVAARGPEALSPDQAVLQVEIRLDGVLAKHIEMRLLDDRQVISALLRYDNGPDSASSSIFSPSTRPDFEYLEQALRELLSNRESS